MRGQILFCAEGELKMNLKIGLRNFRVARVAALLAAIVIPVSAFAQNCALCYTQAAGAGERIIQALRGGILILVVPPILICTALTVMAYRKRNQFAEE
jgi:hypothetical protein